MTDSNGRNKKDCMPMDRQNAIVAKDNSLIPALAKLSLSELRLLSFCLSYIDSRAGHRDINIAGAGEPIPQEQVVFCAKVQDLVQVFPSIGEGHAYDIIREAVESINSKPYRNDNFIKSNGEKRRVWYAWFSGFEYCDGTGTFEFQISPQIANLVLSLKENFTRFRLESVYQFKSCLSWKLYENLKQWESKGQWTVTLDEFRQRLNISGKYTIWSNLRNKVIAVAIKEINQYSDIQVSFTKQTRLRSVVGVTFFLRTKEEAEREERVRNDPSIIANIGDTAHDIEILMRDGGLTETQSRKISAFAKEVGFDVQHKLEQVLTSYKKASSGEKAKSGTKAGYVCACFKQALGPTLFDHLITHPTDAHEEISDQSPRPRTELHKASTAENPKPETPEKTLPKLSNAEQLELAKCRTRNQVSRNNGICGEGDEGKEQCQKCMLYYKTLFRAVTDA